MSSRDYFAGILPPTMGEILNSREERAAIQRRLIGEYKTPLICLTINTPGRYKNYPLALHTADEGCLAISRILQSAGMPPSYDVRQLDLPTGPQAFFCVPGNETLLKRLMMGIEDTHPLGRLFDIDVFGLNALPLKGEGFGRGQRRCIICGESVWVCSRSRAHPYEQLANRTAQIAHDFFVGRKAQQFCRLAIRALLYEVSITPKPGLVDRSTNGAHTDMNFFTFIDSGCALIPYFEQAALSAIRFEGQPEQLGGLLPSIKTLGMLAEGEMLAATGGVNTHKGAIFSLGIICAAAGYLYGRGEKLTAGALFDVCAAIAAPALAEFCGDDNFGGCTYGRAAYARQSIMGARGQAAAGFPAVSKVGLPTLMRYLQSGLTLEEAGVLTLLHLIATVDDTNIIGRAGSGVLGDIQAKIGALLQNHLQNPAGLLKAADKLEREFIVQNLSPGGSADLLALTLFVYWVVGMDFPPMA